MAEAHENEVVINQDNNFFHGEVGEGGAEAQARVEEQAEDLEHAETFAVTQSMIALWDYAQEITEDNMEFTQAHPQVPHPIHPPIQMLCRNKCLLVLMVEDRCEAVIQLWEELNEIEHLLGLENI
ncbi:uncharacterized protein EDB93DRAFT_1253839 [Suillus bovinus]|uniref:uncharacterized protein n=1 Tax=Suillus bovinus TaxID=48563 RepID=UPI001B86ABD4|nr:uncharacterized protein EDB93DRAFT_1253839 [Suillus bovinus]KAG2136982.1 hypothetical protein EDB93DRAFT_1253839 [Suillus bovinus]